MAYDGYEALRISNQAGVARITIDHPPPDPSVELDLPAVYRSLT